MHATRPMIEIDEALCDGCGLCIPSCHEGALEIRDGKARLVAERLCDGLGACLGECPRGALHVVERAAEPFVEPYAPLLAPQAHARAPHAPAPQGHDRAAHVPAPAPQGHDRAAHVPAPAPQGHDRAAHVPAPAPQLDAQAHASHGHGGCPGAQVRAFKPLPGVSGPPSDVQLRAAAGRGPGHWPVQVRLVPPHAPFLADAALLVVADCVPLAMPTFHGELLDGHAAMMGCPKFDDIDDYTQRFARLFQQSGVRSVTVAVMEVPCCQSLPAAVLRGREAARSDVPVELVIVGVDGRVQDRRLLV